MTDSEKAQKRRQYLREWRARNPGAVKKHNNASYSADPYRKRQHARESYHRNKGTALARNKAWREANREPRLKYLKEYGKANRAKRRQYVKTRYQTDPAYRILCVLRASLACRLKRAKAGSKSASTVKLLGCSIPSFMLYLESKFETGMTWANYGTVWEIDHELPCAMFDLTNPEHQKRCFHFSNLQPLFAEANRAKSDHIPNNTQSAIQ